MLWPVVRGHGGRTCGRGGAAHGQVIDQGDDHQQRKGHLKDGREQNRDHLGSLGREGAGPVHRIGRGESLARRDRTGTAENGSLAHL